MEKKKIKEIEKKAKEFESLEEPYKGTDNLKKDDKEFREEIDELTKKMFRKKDN